ncbi:MAG TPA: LuxR C-terminal-related transcriptional regulator [Acidimicrobiales bacterium]|nr:LuxR C-terminal-related transcriptional regulator [Acidimicrobiales bacterium]
MPDWPLVGREQELTVLRDLLTGSAPGGVVLAGPSGVGKTRLGHECLLVAEQAGLATAGVIATRSAARLPFGAVAPLLHAALPEPGTIDDRADLLRRSVAALAEQSDSRRLLLFVDDAHLLDDASATLVHQVAATGAVTVLATVRAGEPAPDPVIALWKDGLAERVEVGPLGPESISELLAAVLGGPVDPATAVQFTERCQGNALFLRELVMGALDDGSLADDGGMWRLGRPLSPSARLVEIVEARLGRLEEDERALMELVAYGEPLGTAELASLSDPATAETLERRDLLASRLDGRRLQVHLAHPIYGDVVRARTPALRARMIARSLADAVEGSCPERREDILRVATWRLLAGGGHPHVLLEGATIARWRYDFPLAESLARAAVDAGAGFDAALLAALVTGLQGRRDEAEAELAGLAGEAADDGRRGQVAIARFDNALVRTARDELGVLDEAERAITNPDWHDRIASRRLSLVLTTRGPRAGADATRLLAARVGGEALDFARLVGAYSLARLGRLDAALEVAAQARTARQSLDSRLVWYPWWHTVTECLALLYAGRFPEAERIVAAHHRQALAEGSAEAQAAFAVLGADAVGDRGRVRTAARRAREALAVDQGLGRLVFARRDHIAGALALALAGQADAAADELSAVDALGVAPLPGDEVDLLQARAWTAAAAGDLPWACDQFEHAADQGELIGDLVGEVTALHALARLGRARDVRDRLGHVAGRIDGDLAPARAAHTDALAEGDAAALDAVGHDFESMGADLLAAEAAADAAVALRRSGELREAAAAERRAGMLAERCEGPATPALHAIDARARLTPAERDTAVLAAAGRANKEIASQLHVSSRTVENRLQRVYEKLGVSGRTELPAALALDE